MRCADARPIAEVASCLALVVLGGCMKIYPYPDLPDVRLSWQEDACGSDIGDVVITLTGVDQPSMAVAAVPCSTRTASFPDVARQNYQLNATVYDLEGAVDDYYDQELDLRDGFDENIDLYFGGSAGSFNFVVGWDFDMAASCQSLSATEVGIRFTIPGGPPTYEYSTPCENAGFLTEVPDGIYTVGLRARAGGIVVAASPESAEIAISWPDLVDLGVVTLTPCGTTCP